ncbi:LysR family transcriptional regulator [Polymorphobacter sp. PAMC 29334]|uniref:LysR family transcriptional regulator n=1 Tax=Polymorphobacter sp. PAMC 29334 TaxID=2862331 RepID=UPI001C673DD1|nr:LysR family transcriptional regulator [Polymorphobacter sp. PAMC 29334]QYE36319.1 LysR family transcriptional regulator [Polymorphobacter sp. PAMC 29334]
MGDRFEDLRTFVAVADAGGITSAAKALDVAKSAVSRRVSELEQRLGVKLVERTTRSFALTAAGRRYHVEAHDLLESLARLDATAGDVAPNERVRRLSLVAVQEAGPARVGAAVARFLDKHPGSPVDLTLLPQGASNPAAGDADVVIGGPGGKAPRSARRIAGTAMTVTASRGYLARSGRPKVPGDVAAHLGIISTMRSGVPAWMFRDGVTVVPQAALTTSDDAAALAAALAGAGLVCLPTDAVAGEIAAGRLEALFEDGMGEPPRLWLSNEGGTASATLADSLAASLTGTS